MDLGKKKKLGRIRTKKEDRISSLPDEVIHNILSRIEITEAVQTCVLSRRWNRIWTTLPHLIFSSYNFILNDVFYVNFVEQFLLKRNHSSEVSAIGLYVSYFRSDLIISTVNYALAHNVKEFSISSAKFTEEFPNWSFPVLTTLHLENCKNVPLMSWSLPTLTTLHLEGVTFQDKIVSFEGFVHLKNLTFKESVFSDGMEVLVITSLNLENLTVSSQNYGRSCLFVVSAPNLSCLEYTGNSPLSLSAEDGFPCLERVDIDIDIGKHQWKKYFAEKKQEYFQQLLSMFQVICGAKFLTLSFNTIQVISSDPDFSEYPPSPFGNLKCLKLDKRQFDRFHHGYLPPKSLNHVISYLLSSSPGAAILIQDLCKIIRDYNPEVNMLRWTGSSLVVEYEAISLDDEYTSPSSESHAADEVDNYGEEIRDDLNEDADEKQAMFQDGHISDGGDEETIAQDLIEELVEEDHVRQDPELEASVVQQKTIMEVGNRIPGQVNSMSNVHVNGTCSCSENDNLSLWEGHKVHSKFVDLLHYIKEKYPETFVRFDPQTEMIYTIGLNTLCTSVSAFFEVTRTNVTTSIITHYRGLFSDLEGWGFNTTWLVNHLNNADEICSIDNCIDGAQGEVQERQALCLAKRAKMSEIQEAFGHFTTTLAAGYR